jgi:hypothetical protein
MLINIHDERNEATLQLKRLVAGFLSLLSVFDSRPNHLEFISDKIVRGWISKYLQFPSPTFILRTAAYQLIVQ